MEPTQFLHLKFPRSATSHASSNGSELRPVRRTSTLLASQNLFKLKSLNTGEEIDLREEHETEFVHKLAKMLTLDKGSAIGLQAYLYFSYSEERRQANFRLWEAAEAGDMEMCLDALKLAQPNSKGLNEWTALHLAAHMGHVSVCLMLLQPVYGSDVNALTSLSRTPLHLASINGHQDIVECLLANCADVDVQDKDGWTALHHAANMSHNEIVKLLIASNCDETCNDHQGKTPYDIAKSAEIAHLLTPLASKYSRTLFNGVLMRNSREDKVTNLLRLSLGGAATTATYDSKNNLAPRRSLGAMETSSSDAEEKHRVGPMDFALVCLLGKGTFGAVYYSKRVGSSEEYALKVLHKTEVTSKPVLRYTLTERNVLATVHHPFIVDMKFAFQTPSKLVLALEYCPGGDLGYHISREKRMSEDRARFYICEVLLALEELHSHDIVYRDLKPDNVVLDADGHAKLTDFGLAKELSRSNNTTKTFCGSMAYMAPELLRREVYGKGVDWYLLGVLLYEMLIGTPPFFSCNKELLFDNIQKARLKFPKFVSGRAQSLVRGLMERDPNERLGAKNVEDIKRHSFFSGIDWTAAINRKLKPFPIPRIPRKPEFLPLESVFGDLITQDEHFLDDWSFPG